MGGESCSPSEESVDPELLAAGWPTLRADRANTGAAPAEVSPDLEGTARLDRRELVLNGGSIHAMAVADGVIYYSDDNSTYALNAETGEERWSIGAPGGYLGTSVTVTADTVYVPTRSDGLWAIERSTGDQRFRVSLDGSTPIVPVNDRLVAGTIDGTIHALEPGCGDSDWKYDAGERTRAYIGVSGDIVVAAIGSTLVGINLDDGSERWRITTPTGDVRTHPAIIDGTAFVDVERYGLIAFDVESGERLWSVRDALTVTTQPAVTSEWVIVIDSRGRLRAYDAESGSLGWTFESPSPIATAPTLVGDSVLVATEEHLYIVDQEDGRELSRADMYGRRLIEGQDLIVMDTALYLRAGFEATSWLYRFTP